MLVASHGQHRLIFTQTSALDTTLAQPVEFNDKLGGARSEWSTRQFHSTLLTVHNRIAALRSRLLLAPDPSGSSTKGLVHVVVA